jgi:SAM-dependent methyltransferase
MIERCVVSTTHARPVWTFAKQGTDVYECPTCGCIMGDVSFAQDLYESDGYYTLAHTTLSAIELEWGFRCRYILRKVAAWQAGVRLLDVGAGNGYFVFLAQHEFGMEADGVEVSNAEIEFARKEFGVRLHKAALHELPRSYDVVSSLNVLEHVKDPTDLLRDMTNRVRPGGLLVLTTPNPACIHRRLRGLKRWAMIDPPHHINLFPRAALEELIRGVGFSVLAYETVSTYIRFVRSFDTRERLLRRTLFQTLRWLGLGADHLFMARRATS